MSVCIASNLKKNEKEEQEEEGERKKCSPLFVDNKAMCIRLFVCTIAMRYHLVL